MPLFTTFIHLYLALSDATHSEFPVIIVISSPDTILLSTKLRCLHLYNICLQIYKTQHHGRRSDRASR